MREEAEEEADDGVYDDPSLEAEEAGDVRLCDRVSCHDEEASVQDDAFQGAGQVRDRVVQKRWPERKERVKGRIMRLRVFSW